jgi:predicted ATP-dependent protease
MKMTGDLMSDAVDINDTRQNRSDLSRASAPAELSVEQTDIQIDTSAFGFKTTDELEPLDEIVGQNKAMSAIEIGLGIGQEGYNIFVAGLTGTGKKETIRRSLEKRLDRSTVPDDWVYVHNFDNPDEPWAIAMHPGNAKKFQKSMEKLIEQLQENLPKAFRQKDFSREKENLSKKYQNRIQQHTEGLRNLAEERGFDISFEPSGTISFMPLIEGKQPENKKQIDQLPDEEKRRIAEGEEKLTAEINSIIQEQQEMMQSLSEEIKAVERRFADEVIRPLIERIKKTFSDNARIPDYLDKVTAHILENLGDFRNTGKNAETYALMQNLMGQDGAQPAFLEYKVNVLVDHSQSTSAPIVVEEAPTYRNLFGSIDRAVDRRGRLVTNFTQIKAGSLLRANGGYLVFNIEDALTEPFVYKSLKRTLKSGKIQLESYNPWLSFSTGGLRPEPIPFNTKVVAVGKPMIYYLLRFYDDEFGSIFKIKADFDTEMTRADHQQQKYIRSITTIAKCEKLRPFSAGAVTEVLRYSCRRSGAKDKLYTRFSEIIDLLREADYFARISTDGSVVDAAHVKQALDNRVFRSDRIARKMRELIEEGTILIDTRGQKIGQVNGLAILDMGDYAFGKPNRVTASVGLGSEGLINIEREAKLSGSTYDKAVLILTGYLRNTYGRDKPLALSASICFEQSYSGVEGDSASAAELFALLSNISRLPLRQDIAVTGSVNQWGRIQAIGMVNEKIEGFFDVCKVIGMSGRQGVCIPASNIRNLVLREDVRQAVKEGQFHIYPMDTVEEGMELLTGVKAGTRDEPGTLHWLINEQLTEMAQSLHRFGLAGKHTETRIAEQNPREPQPPKTPEDQPDAFETDLK